MGKIKGLISRAFVEQGDEEKERPGYRELGKIIDVRVSEITPNPAQPRKHFPVDELTVLAKSISQNGIVQPLTVRRTAGGFELVSGERRLRAAKLAGLRSVPCIVVRADSARSAVMALIENIQRSDLSCFEEAQAIAALIDSGEITREECAVRLGLAQSTVANKLRLLKLTNEEQQLITENGLSERHARALLRLKDEKLRKEVLGRIIRGKLTVEAAEKLILRLEREEVKKNSYEKRAVMLKDVRLFFNSVNKALEVMRLAGVKADAKRTDYEDHIEYVISIPSANVPQEGSGEEKPPEQQPETSPELTGLPESG
ncbi:MAG: ParB/RepB/Spo0J family partition protein [Ruminococcus sp.]|nr:ParB/RepB/Spo0J family partition protein [Ruminococcus sp.]